MTAHKKDKMLLKDKGVLTEDGMLAYLHNTLEPEDRSEVERLLQEDPFMREAMEGMQGAPSKTEASSSLLSINQKISDRISGKKKRFGVGIHLHWTAYAWAAVIFGLVVSLGVVLVSYLDTRQENLAMQQPSATEQLNESSGQEPSLISSDHSGTAETEKPEVSSKEEIINREPDAKPVVPQVLSVPATTPTPPSAATSAAAPAAEGLAKDKSETTAPAVARTDAAAAKKKAEEKTVDDESLKDISLDLAMKNFNSGDYKTSAAQFDVLLKKQPNNPEALYFGGISDYINEDYKKSEKNFDALLKEGTRFMEGSKWYKANILLKKGKKEEAKKILQDLSITGGSYRERANKKLNELE